MGGEALDSTIVLGIPVTYEQLKKAYVKLFNSLTEEQKQKVQKHLEESGWVDLHKYNWSDKPCEALFDYYFCGDFYEPFSDLFGYVLSITHSHLYEYIETERVKGQISILKEHIEYSDSYEYSQYAFAVLKGTGKLNVKKLKKLYTETEKLKTYTQIYNIVTDSELSVEEFTNKLDIHGLINWAE